MFAFNSFIASAIVIVGLMALRRMEMSRGRRFVPRFRLFLDELALRFVNTVLKRFPRYLLRSFKYIVIHVTEFASLLLLGLVRLVENRLHIAVRKVRGKKHNLIRERPSSSYLEDVKVHKEKVSKTIEELREVE